MDPTNFINDTLSMCRKYYNEFVFLLLTLIDNERVPSLFACAIGVVEKKDSIADREYFASSFIS